jgi:gas vesicle protein
MSTVNFSPNSSKIALNKPRQTTIEQFSQKPIQAGGVNINRPEANPNISSTASKEANAGRREQVENRASNTLLNASQSLSSRQNLVEGLGKTLSSISSLVKELKTEVNPNRKEAIKNEINSLVEDVETSFNKAVERDPKLRESITFTALAKPADETNATQKFSSVSVAGVPSPEDLGLNSLDLDDIEATEETISNAQNIVAGKSNELNSNATEIGLAVKSKQQALEAEAPENPEDSAKKLADAIKTSAQFFVQDNEPKPGVVSSLVVEKQLEGDSKSPAKQSLNEGGEGNNIRT